MYFKGNAPECGYYALATDSDLTIYYIEGTEGWEDWKPMPWDLDEEPWDPNADADPDDDPIDDPDDDPIDDPDDDPIDDPDDDPIDDPDDDPIDDPDVDTVVEFADVAEDAWYSSAVQYAVENSLMNGTGNNKFEPESSMTRAMLVTVLWRYAGEPLEGENSFTDVPSGQWYTEAVAWASANGIVGGVGNNKFDPDGNITREQMAAILYRYANSQEIGSSAQENLSSFPDANNVSSWASDAIKWAVAEGLINGSNGKLMPQGNATRAQVATILMRFIENVAK